MPRKTPTPKPVPVNVVCDLCGEPWHQHNEDNNGQITTLECIRLLKAKSHQQIIWSDHWSYRPLPYYPPTQVTPSIICQSSANYTPNVLTAHNTG